MQSAWWTDQNYGPSQNWGCTNFAAEGYNPNHPECPYFHEGVDIPLPYGTPIYAGYPGVVIGVGFPGYGPYAVALRIGPNDIYLGHLSESDVAPGDSIQVHQQLGRVGSEGFSTGPHLHFEVRPAGGGYRTSIDPLPFLSAAPSDWVAFPPSPSDSGAGGNDLSQADLDRITALEQHVAALQSFTDADEIVNLKQLNSDVSAIQNFLMQDVGPNLRQLNRAVAALLVKEGLPDLTAYSDSATGGNNS